jgi:beta-galactosidase
MHFAKSSALAIMAALAIASGSGAAERSSLNDGWRFHIGDPEGTSDRLLYDVRPVVEKSADGKEADARPDAAVKVEAGAQTVLKPWILPTANALIRDPARRHVRPAQNAGRDPGSDVPYLSGTFDDSRWRKVTLPHDWAIEGPFLKEGPYGGMGRLKTWGPVWYRRTLEIPAADKGKSVFLDVDGAMSYATVWLNGHLVGGWPYGYASWRVDLTPYLNTNGKNQLAIRLDNPIESARWYPGAGLYRNVWLVKTNPVHVGQWGTFVTTPEVSKTSATVAIDVAIDNDGASDADVSVATQIYVLNANGSRGKQTSASITATPLRVTAKGKAHLKGTTALGNPRLWGPPPTQTPNRYVAVTTVSSKGKVLDTYDTPFGVRQITFDPDRGVIVNGERIELKGVNNHHDLGALGAAFNVRAAERQLEMLHEMGANAVRMSHNPPAPELLELADRMGFLVIDEVFDSWERKKTPLDFHLIFPDWHEPDLRAMLRRDRNHPSVILWSVGNEVGEQYTGKDGAAIARKLVGIVREEDPTRPATNAMNWAQADMPLPAEMDVINLNYQGAGIRTLPGKFPAFRKAFPDKVIITSESASALSSRGEYQFPVPGVYSASVRPGVGGDPKTKQVSAYELFAADFGSSADKSWAAQDQYPYVAGEFVWTGFDYIGEPTPYYDARSSYSGIIDLAGFKKDRFWLYQSRWRPDLAMAHILPHWTWPGREGDVTPVHVFTSGDEAELFVNGASQGRKKKNPYEYRLRWDYVTYQPGTVRVVTYRNGKEWATDEVRTAGTPARLDAMADRTIIAADGKDLSFVTIRVADAEGLTAPRADNRIRFRIEGPADLVATDNGDPTSFESFQSPGRNAFNGLALAVIRTRKGQAGKIVVHAEAEGLIPAKVELTSKR